MHISVFSLFTSVLWVTVFTKIISVLRKRMPYMQHFSIHALLFLLLLCALRLLFPLELPYSRPLESTKIMPAFQLFLRKPLFTCEPVHMTPALLLTTVWFTGAAVLFIRQILEYRRLKHVLYLLPASDDERLYYLLANAGLQKPLNHVKIIKHSSITSPASAGLIHPVILLPDICFDDEELLGIFIHEAAHLQLKHHLVKLVMELICICFWWNPILRDLFSETAYALEMHSDQTVCTKLNQKQQQKYLHAILKVFMNANQKESPSAFTCGLLEHPDSIDLQQRFRMILENRYQSKSKLLPGIAAFALCTFLLSYTFVLQPYSEPTPADYGHVDTSTDQNFFYIETDDGYDLYEYPERFLDHIDNKKNCLPWLQIYSDMEEMKQKWKRKS
ncbi:MAG: M56 family metallopeptidase [Eubacterium sp.]|nr:M56 family metallopeptidase [Eubacterium sp.]